MRILVLIFLAAMACTSPKTAEQAAGECLSKTCIGMNAMVVTAHPEATKAGLAVLKEGGNAIDAMVAVHFALAVVYPSAGNLGGGGFMVYRTAEGQAHTLDFREKAPARATETMYLDESGEVISESSRAGYKAAGVPGSVAGMAEAHKKFGKLSWAELLRPALALAENGFAITQSQANDFNQLKAAFIRHNDPSAQLALVREESWREGDKLLQPQLAATLKRIMQQGKTGFYEGETASIIAEEMKKGGGLISKEDLKSYEAIWREPLTATIGPYRVISMGLPSSGGVALLQLLHMSRHFPLKQWGYHSTNTVHAMAEMEKLVYVDRTLYLGDPDQIKVPLQQLLDSAYLRRKAKTINLHKATPGALLMPKQLGQHTWPESEETTHFSIIDEQGGAVALTTTLNASYGAKTFISGAGFLLNNQMDDFSIKPGHPNMYGLLGGQANAIAPGKRMLSSMTPTILERNDELYMVLGTPGGATIITSVYQALLNVVLYKMNMKEAVWAGRFHHQGLPDVLYLEEGALPEHVQDSLRLLGHTLETRSPIGRIDAILIQNRGRMEGAADPRGDDMAGGY